jgi:CheY-like chemotaxis protein
MKKVLLANDLKSLFMEKSSFLERADFMVFTAATNDELLKVHREEKTDLIVTRLDLPGVRSEEVFSSIRKSADLRGVSVIIIYQDTLANRERCKQCSANAVFTSPVDTALLHMKAEQFLNIAPRKSYRAVLAVGIQGKFKNKPRPFWTENISARGMLIRTEEPLSKGDGIFFSFFLPDGAHVSGYGEIARAVQPATGADAFLYGIRFTNIAPDVQSAIEIAIKKNTSGAYQG